MAEIKVSAIEIQNCIKELNVLKTECDGLKPKPPFVLGGGKTVGELEGLGNLYKLMFEEFSGLLDSTIAFLQNAESTYTQSDQYVASQIGGN